MTEQLVIGIVGVIVLGISAQWLAWRFKMPSILLLLLFGFVAGPLTGEHLFNPASLQGDWLSAFVSLAIGIILFEGGLSLRVRELRGVGRAVLNLITVGVLATWMLAALAAHMIAEFPVGLAVQIGAILTVTGPTVVVPLLRHVRPKGRIGVVAKWEGITVDPVGAILAVLVLEVILLINQPGAEAAPMGGAVLHAMEGLLLTVFISIGVSTVGAALLILVLRQRLVPDYLQGSFALMIVAGTFALANVLQEEAGLLEATLMGIIVANQKYVPVRRISEFKENLQVLLIGSLFILLSARLELSAFAEIDLRSLAFLGVLVLVVRPLSVMASSIGTGLRWREQVFLSWLAPRGIVAAAVASLFSLRLETIYPGQAERLVPIVFFVIVGTVAIYGLTISPLARYLGLAEPNAQGVLFVGAHPWAQQLARTLQELGFRILVIDSNERNIERARHGGLPAMTANALSESVIDELDLSGIGRLLALTPNDEVNSLAALHFSEIFESNSVYQLAARPESRLETISELPRHLRGRPLFGLDTTFVSLTDRFNDGDEIRTFAITSEHPFKRLQDQHQGEMTLLFVVRSGQLLIHSEAGDIAPESGDTIVALVPPQAKLQGIREETPFERLVTRASVIDVPWTADYEQIVRQAAALLGDELGAPADRLEQGFIDSTRFGAIPVTHGAALPHFRLPGIGEPAMALVRSQSGTTLTLGEETLEEEAGKIYAIFFLVSDQENPGQHLRTLANIAGCIDDPRFMGAWRTAADEQQLKEALLREERYAAVVVRPEGMTARLIGQEIRDLRLPRGALVALLQRRGQVCSPDPETVLEEGDRLTIIGDPSGIQAFRETATDLAI